MKPGPGHGSWPRFFSTHISFARRRRTVLEERAWEPSMMKANGCVLSCRPQGMCVWKEREDSGDCIGQS